MIARPVSVRTPHPLHRQRRKAAELSVSNNTVKTHKRNLYAKLGAHRCGEAVTRARTVGLLAPGRSVRRAGGPHTGPRASPDPASDSHLLVSAPRRARHDSRPAGHPGCFPHGAALTGLHWSAPKAQKAKGVRTSQRPFYAERLVAGHLGSAAEGSGAGSRQQYTGTAGRIENRQVGVFLTCTTTTGHTLIDRELYLPRRWTGDTDHCVASGVPEDTTFATKPALPPDRIGWR